MPVCPTYAFLSLCYSIDGVAPPEYDGGDDGDDYVDDYDDNDV